MARPARSATCARPDARPCWFSPITRCTQLCGSHPVDRRARACRAQRLSAAGRRLRPRRVRLQPGRAALSDGEVNARTPNSVRRTRTSRSRTRSFSAGPPDSTVEAVEKALDYTAVLRQGRRPVRTSRRGLTPSHRGVACLAHARRAFARGRDRFGWPWSRPARAGSARSSDRLHILCYGLDPAHRDAIDRDNRPWPCCGWGPTLTLLTAGGLLVIVMRSAVATPPVTAHAHDGLLLLFPGAASTQAESAPIGIFIGLADGDLGPDHRCWCSA